MSDKTGIIPQELKVSVEELLDRPVESVSHVDGGRNSRLYLVVCKDTARLALKLYYRDADDGRDRLGVEFGSLKFLWDNGVRCVPEPVAANHNDMYGVYEYIDGERVSEVSPSDIDQTLEFVRLLRDLGQTRESALLPAASEACFSAESAFRAISCRLDRLLGVENKGGEYQALREFLRMEYVPLLEEIRETLTAKHHSLMKDIVPESRVLSPSDFGFHNALKKKNGKLIYLDFEYFGWDDPAKMISDFLLHPGVELEFEMRQRFFAGALRLLGETSLYDRVMALYPIYGLNWCLILLNEFLPQKLERRKFAGGSRGGDDARARQLSKAKNMISIARRGYEGFPFRPE